MLTYKQEAAPHEHVERRVKRIVAQGRTQYQEYLFFETDAHGICIVLDGDIQSCQSDEAIYHEALVHPAMLLHPKPRSVLVMGGGEGATVREVLRHSCVTHVTMVDLDREFVELCHEHAPSWHQNALEDERVSCEYTDIRTFLDGTERRFDVVIGDLVDVTEANSAAGALYSEDFYDSVLAHTSDDGIVATQASALQSGRLKQHVLSRENLERVFRNVASMGIVVPSFYSLWGYVIASQQRLVTDIASLAPLFDKRVEERGLGELVTGAAALASAFQLPDWIAREL